VNETSDGLIAEDAEKVNPAYGTPMEFPYGWENVTVGNITRQVRKTVNGTGVVYTRIIPHLIGATQELEKLIVQMNAQIQYLKNKTDHQEQAILELQRLITPPA
jgi:hypothetical protein